MFGGMCVRASIPYRLSPALFAAFCVCLCRSCEGPQFDFGRVTSFDSESPKHLLHDLQRSESTECVVQAILSARRFQRLSSGVNIYLLPTSTDKWEIRRINLNSQTAAGERHSDITRTISQQ